MTSPDKFARFFRAADTDNSGSLNMGELVKAVRKAGFRGTDVEIKAMFRSADASGDGNLSFDEFMVCMGQQPEKNRREARLRYLFHDYDKDGNGTLEASDMKAVFKEIGTDLTDKELKRVMAMMDSDGDGKIEYEEFLKYYDK